MACTRKSMCVQRNGRKNQSCSKSLAFDDSLGYYIAFNRTERVTNRVDVMGFPMWANISSGIQAHKLRVEILKSDMLSPFGIRSTSALDPRYNNINEIKPYSNWEGPVWVNANAVLTYGLSKYGYRKDAIDIAKRVVQTLANDAENQGTWHEGYDSENGKGVGSKWLSKLEYAGCYLGKI